MATNAHNGFRDGGLRNRRHETLSQIEFRDGGLLLFRDEVDREVDARLTQANGTQSEDSAVICVADDQNNEKKATTNGQDARWCAGVRSSRVVHNPHLTCKLESELQVRAAFLCWFLLHSPVDVDWGCWRVCRTAAGRVALFAALFVCLLLFQPTRGFPGEGPQPGDATTRSVHANAHAN